MCDLTYVYFFKLPPGQLNKSSALSFFDETSPAKRPEMPDVLKQNKMNTPGVDFLGDFKSENGGSWTYAFVQPNFVNALITSP